MTSTMLSKTSPALRPSLRLILPLGVVGGVLGDAMVASPALAGTPKGWSDAGPVSTMDFLIMLIALPLGCVLLITVLFYLPILARGEKLSSSASPVEDEWLGGPRGGRNELTQSETSSAKDTGGASGNW